MHEFVAACAYIHLYPMHVMNRITMPYPINIRNRHLLGSNDSGGCVLVEGPMEELSPSV